MNVLIAAEKLLNDNPTIRMMTMESAQAYRIEIRDIRLLLESTIAAAKLEVNCARQLTQESDNESDYIVADALYISKNNELYELRKMQQRILGLIYF